MAVSKYIVNNPLPQAYSISISYPAKDCCQVSYISNAAFIFSKYLDIPPLEIAKNCATFYAQAETHSQDFVITAVPPGFLQLKLTNPKLAYWLQHLPFLPLRLPNFPFPEYTICLGKYNVFAVQYAYSRCYSLLQLAQREGSITLAEISASKIKSIFPHLSTVGQECSILIIDNPQLLSWLNYTQRSQFFHPAEYALVIQLVKVIDEFYSSNQLNLDYWAKIALNVSQALAEFYKHCRIFGETNAQEPKLAQGRLGLILATYTILKLLLQRLGVFAPQEL